MFLVFNDLIQLISDGWGHRFTQAIGRAQLTGVITKSLAQMEPELPTKTDQTSTVPNPWRGEGNQALPAKAQAVVSAPT